MKIGYNDMPDLESLDIKGDNGRPLNTEEKA